MTKPLIILHGWSDSRETFNNLASFYRDKGQRDVETLYLGDWLSLNDEISYADLAVAMQRAWLAMKLPTSPRSADVVIHSTGALVVREWLTTFYQPDNNPIDHFLMLAPANYGSPLAHKGRAFYGRIFKGWKTGLQTGTQLLHGLELGSEYTFNLALKDVLSRKYWYGAKRIKATVMVGNTGYGGVRAAANEDGSDGTVRISTANLDSRLLNVDYSNKRTGPRINFMPPVNSHKSAFTILDGDNHSTITLSDGKERSADVERLYLDAINVKANEWDAWCEKLEKRRRQVEDQAVVRRRTEPFDVLRPHRSPGRHVYQNTVVRVYDDIGNTVPDYFVEFYEKDSDTGFLGEFFHKNVLRTVHRPEGNPNYRSMYVDTTLLHNRIDKPEHDHLKISVMAEPVFEAIDPEETGVGYSAQSAAYHLSPLEVQAMFARNETLLVNLVIKRNMNNVFNLVKAFP